MMDLLKAKIEAVLFIAGKPLAFRALAKLIEEEEKSVVEALQELIKEQNQNSSGIHILEHEGTVQMVSNPALAVFVEKLSKEEFPEELTRPQLETLSVIAYRGPVTKPEIEQIRGVNCSLILRHLLIRGLIEEKEDTSRLQNVYSVTMDFVRHLGLSKIDALPEFEHYHADERIDKLIQESEEEPQKIETT